MGRADRLSAQWGGGACPSLDEEIVRQAAQGGWRERSLDHFRGQGSRLAGSAGRGGRGCRCRTAPPGREGPRQAAGDVALCPPSSTSWQPTA
eukprot:365720-Chlamydomonas_euryale.AAC.29